MELNLMKNYPKSSRPIDERAKIVTEEHKEIAKKFGKEYFDGDRMTGYGGYNYNPKYWSNVVNDFISYYKLGPGSRVLDAGCAKGYMIYDMVRQYPDISVRGIDISEYAIQNAKSEVKDLITIGSVDNLEFPDKSFDLVISINTIHNLPIDRCRNAIMEIERVGKNAFVMVDAWRNDEEERLMKMWNLTALTYMHVDDWVKLFEDCGYTGDYWWFIAGE